MQHRQRVQRAPTRRLGALLDREVVAEHARVARARRRGCAGADPTCAPGHRARPPRRAGRAAGTGPGKRQAELARAGRRRCVTGPPLEEGRRLGAVPHVAAVEHVVHERVVGRAELRVDAPQRRDRLARGVDREDEVVDAVLGEQRAAARSATRRRGARSRRSGRAGSASRTCSTGSGAPIATTTGSTRRSRRGPARRSRRGTACTSRRTRARRRPCASASTSGCAASTSSERWRSHRLRWCGTTPAIVAHTRSQSQWYLSSGIQSARSPKPRRSGASTT